MENNDNNTIRMRDEGIYIINKDYKIVYMDVGIKTIFPKCELYQVCYKTLRQNEEQCPDCPLRQFQLHQASSTNKLLYYKPLNGWVDCTMVSLTWPNEGDCTLISLKRVLEGNRDLSLTYDNGINYELLVEFDLMNKTYTILFQENADHRWKRKGNMDEFITEVENRYIHPLDQPSFHRFHDTEQLYEEMTKICRFQREFRVRNQKNEYRKMIFDLTLGQKSETAHTLFCFVVDAGKANTAVQYNVLDPLTGLYTINAFRTFVEQQLEADNSREYGLLHIDIEHFKIFNDWYGVAEGDKLLKYIAQQIKAKAEAGHGIASRISGDDFILLLDREECEVSKIQKEIIDWMQNYDTSVKFLPNGGIYLIEDRTIPVTLMCDCAQLALNSVKGNFSNRVALYNDNMKQKLKNEQEVLFGVKNGLEHDEFEVYYQPQYNARTAKVIGAEALVRWRHPQKGLLPPSEFIPVLESSGFITKVDFFVWEKVCQYLHERIQKGLDVIPISVNVSRLDIYQYNITEVFQQLMQKYDLNPRLVEIEITESAYADDFQHLIDEVAKLRKAGFIVLMDDFGSGYSSLNMLKDVEIDILKVDMKFLQMDYEQATKGSSILRSVMQMGKWLGLRIIAEGVETKQQVDHLMMLDFEFMQGYYFYRPMCEADFTALLDCKEHIDTRGIFAKQMPKINLDDLFHRDITSEVMLSNILGGIAIYEIVKDHLEVKEVNDSYYRMTGCNPIDLFQRGVAIEKQVYKDDLPLMWAIFRKAEQNPDHGASGTFRRYRWNGEIMWMHLRVFFLRKKGERKIYYGNIADYTDIMNMQNDMLTLKNTMPGDVVEIKVKDGKVLSRRAICAGLAKAHGYETEEYIRLLETSGIRLLDEDSREETLRVMNNPTAWGKSSVTKFSTRSKDGKLLHLEQELHYVGRVENVDVYNAFCTDITDDCRKEKELLESQSILQNVLGFTAGDFSGAFLTSDKDRDISSTMQGGMIGTYCEEGYPLYFASDEMLRMLGYSSYEDLECGIQGNVMNTIHPDDRSNVFQDIGDRFYEGLVYTTNYRMVRKDGSCIRVIDKGRIIKEKDGRLAVVSTCMDIGEILNVKKELDQVRKDMDQLHNLIPGGYYTCYCTPDFDFKHISLRFLKVLGYTREEISEKFQDKMINMVVPEDRAILHDQMKIDKKNDVKVWQYRLFGANGVIWVCDCCHVAVQGKERYLTGIILDITENMERQLEANVVMETANADVFSIQNGKITYHTGNLASFMGYEKEEYQTLLKNTNGSCFTDPRDRAMVREAIRHAVRDKTDINLIFRSLTKQKKTRYMHLKTIHDVEDSYRSQYYGIIRDVTALVEKEDELDMTKRSYRSIIRQLKLNIWEYDGDKDELTIFIQKDSIATCLLTASLETDFFTMKDFMEQIRHIGEFSEEAYYILSSLEKMIRLMHHNTTLDLTKYRDTSPLHMKLSCEHLYDEDGGVRKVVGFIQDIA